MIVFEITLTIFKMIKRNDATHSSPAIAAEKFFRRACNFVLPGHWNNGASVQIGLEMEDRTRHAQTSDAILRLADLQTSIDSFFRLVSASMRAIIARIDVVPLEAEVANVV